MDSIKKQKVWINFNVSFEFHMHEIFELIRKQEILLILTPNLKTLLYMNLSDKSDFSNCVRIHMKEKYFFEI